MPGIALPGSIRYVQLDFLNSLTAQVQAQHGAAPNYAGDIQQDMFSNSLHILGSSLRRLDLRLKADAGLFCPSGAASYPPWPNLEYLNITFHPATPSGAWYFDGPSDPLQGETNIAAGYTITDSMYPPLREHEDVSETRPHGRVDISNEYETLRHASSPFRNTPNNTHLEPFLSSFAKAATEMRELRAAAIWTPLGEDRAFGITYTMPGELTALYDTFPEDWTLTSPLYPRSTSACRRLHWHTDIWRPSPHLHELFQRIGRRFHGDALQERWNNGGEWPEWEPSRHFENSRACFPRPEWHGGYMNMDMMRYWGDMEGVNWISVVRRLRG